MWTIRNLALLTAVVFCGGPVAVGAEGPSRQWSDASGRFKIEARLVEVRDGDVYLQNAEGKTLKIPRDRLSAADQSFLDSSNNPFEMVESPFAPVPTPSPTPTPAPTSTTPSAASTSSAGGAALWSTPQTPDWDQAEQFTTLAGVQWQLPDHDAALGFEPQRAALMKKSTFHEHMHPAVVDSRTKRAVVGFTVSFAVPKPLSRLSLVDLTTGKAVHSDPVESNMRPLALLGNGTSVLMVGAGDQRGGYETKDQLQIWRFDGKSIIRSASWVPYPDDKTDFGKVSNGEVLVAAAVDETRVITLSDKGHIALWDLSARRPIWHGRLSERNFSMQLSADRKLLALFDEQTLMVVDPQTAQILGSTALPQGTPAGWIRVAWSPSGKNLLLTSINQIRVLDTESGQWIHDFALPGGPVAPNGLSYPDEDYALLNNQLLVHLPTKIQICSYQNAGSIETIGDVSLIAMHGDAGGILAPGKFPHPAAAEMLEKAQSDPTMFLIHPGVEVSIDVSGVSGPHRQTAQQGLTKSAQDSGYKVVPSSPIKIAASIDGPKQEAVSYIAAGSYIVNRYTSWIKLQHNGQDLWTTSGTNVPGVLMTKQGQTMQQALDEAGKQPNTSVFASVRFPEFMQKPGDKTSPGPQTNALMSSTFTLQGLVDNK